jgi:hypothetical protein
VAVINPTQDYDIIHTLTFAEASGDCPIRLYRGFPSTDTGTVYYRAGTSGDWTTLSVSGTSTTFPVTDTTMQIAHNWNKSGNNYMTPSFWGATNITSISISQNSALTGVMGDHFMYAYAGGCSSLISLAVPDTSGLTSVGSFFMASYAGGCSKLTSLAVPNTSGLTSVGNYFMTSYAYGCSSLIFLDVPDTSGLTSVSDSFMVSYAGGCSSLISLAVPDTSGLTSVGSFFMASYAYGCSSLISLAVPDTSGFTSVGGLFMDSYAYGCSSLIELVLPAVGWFEDNNVDWSVPSDRLGALKGRVLDPDDLSDWKALTAEGKTLYTNYIRDPDLVYYEEATEPITVTTLPVTDITTSSARLWGKIEVGGGELPFWLDFVPQYDDAGTSFHTNTETIPKDCILYMDINGTANAGYDWYVNGEKIRGWTGDRWENRTISVKRGDTLYISGLGILVTELRDTMILRLDDANGAKVAEFDFVLEPASCYLTTAMVGYFGKDDDGIELNSMRALRNHSGHKYQDVLDEYCRISPLIIQGIEQSGQQEYYYGMIKDVVENIVARVANEEWQQAEHAYLNLYNWLKNEFQISETIIEVIPAPLHYEIDGGKIFTLEGEELYSVYFQYRKKGASTWLETAKQTVTVDESQTFDAIVENLDDNTEYEYRAVTDYGGESYYGEILTFKTKLSTEYCEYNADTFRRIVVEQEYIADSLKQVIQTQHYNADTNRGITRAYNLLVDSIRQILCRQDYLGDSIRTIAKEYDYTADSLRQIVKGYDYTVDTFRKVLKEYGYNADTFRKVLKVCQYPADARRIIIRTDAHNADTNRCIIQSQAYTGDTFRKVLKVYQYPADARRIIIRTDAHNADLLRRIVKQYEYAADTMRFVVELGVYVGDTYRVVRAEQVYSADALRQAIKEYEFIADTLRRIARPYIRLKVTLSVQEREVGLGLQERKPSLSIQEREVKLEVE